MTFEGGKNFQWKDYICIIKLLKSFSKEKSLHSRRSKYSSIVCDNCLLWSFRCLVMMKRWEVFACHFHNYESIPFSTRFHTLIEARQAEKKKTVENEEQKKRKKKKLWWKILFIRFIRSWAAQLCEGWNEWTFLFILHIAIHKIWIMYRGGRERAT